MAKSTKKAVKDKVIASKAKSKKQKKYSFECPFEGEYYYAVGRRKSAVAQVRLYKKENSTEDDYIINGKKLNDYFTNLKEKNHFIDPLELTSSGGNIAICVLVKGGGLSGQAQAIKLGISRALVKMDDALRSVLKASGFLTRDARVVERKKPGLRKARRRPQWSKR